MGSLLPGAQDAVGLVVVIDVFRCFTTEAVAFENGAKEIVLVAEIEEAFDLQKQGRGDLLMGEVGGKKPQGFDFGNSPYTYINTDYADKEIVLTTTNGTKALDIAKNAETVLVGSLINIDSLNNLLSNKKSNVLCLCSGWQSKFNLEDTICAGAIVDFLISTGNFTSIEDSSIAAKYLYLSAKDNYLGYLKSSSHRRRLINLNLNEDIKYCLTPNQTDVIPILKDGKIIKL